MGVKAFLKGAWLRVSEPFKFWGPQRYISRMAEAKVVIFCTQVGYIKS